MNVHKIASTAIALMVINFSYSQDFSPGDIKAVMKKVADWQIEHYRDAYTNNEVHHPLDWTNGALYVGMVKWAAMAENEKYYTWLKGVGEAHDWKLHYRKYFADDHTVGQMYLDLYRKFGERR